MRGAEGGAARRADRNSRLFLTPFEREADAVVQDLVIHGLDRNFVFWYQTSVPPSNYVLNADDLALFRRYWRVTGLALRRQEIRTATPMMSSTGRHSNIRRKKDEGLTGT